MPARPQPALPPAIPLADLTPDPENRRTHEERNRTMMADSLRTVGPARSIVIDEHGVILAGNGIAAAAAAIGIQTVRIVEASGQELIAVRRRDLTDAQKRQLALFDNRTSELAQWDVEQLAKDRDGGLDLSAWWTEGEVAMLLGEAVRPTWDGMPEFTQEDEQAWRTLKVHFRTQEDFLTFCRLIGQEDLTDKTKFIWHPREERLQMDALRYVADAPEPE